MPRKTASKITVEELGRLVADLSVPEEELAKYFEVDEERSTPTRPQLKLNPDTVKVPPPSDVEGRARSAALLNSANFICKLRREARTRRRPGGCLCFAGQQPRHRFSATRRRRMRIAQQLPL